MRAKASGIRLTDQDAAVAKAMLARGDRQHDIAAWFGVNGGRIAEIATGESFAHIRPVEKANIPPPGPYPSGRDAMIALEALVAAKNALVSAERVIRQYCK